MINLIKWSLDHALKNLCLYSHSAKHSGHLLTHLYFTSLSPVLWSLLCDIGLCSSLHLYCSNLPLLLPQAGSIRAGVKSTAKAVRALLWWGFVLAVALRKLPRCWGQNCSPALLRLLAEQEGSGEHTFHLGHGAVPQCVTEGCPALSSHCSGSAHTPLGTRISQSACWNPDPLTALSAPACPPALREAQLLLHRALPQFKMNILPIPCSCRQWEQLPSGVFSCWKTYQPYLISFSLDQRFTFPLAFACRSCFPASPFVCSFVCAPVAQVWFEEQCCSRALSNLQSNRITQIIVPCP